MYPYSFGTELCEGQNPSLPLQWSLPDRAARVTCWGTDLTTRSNPLFPTPPVFIGTTISQNLRRPRKFQSFIFALSFPRIPRIPRLKSVSQSFPLRSLRFLL